MWDLFLTAWNGVALFSDIHMASAIDMQLYTDAASTLGFGGYWSGRWFSESWPVQVTQLKPSMAFLELYPIVVAALMSLEQEKDHIPV